jgi:hypothetical protein
MNVETGTKTPFLGIFALKFRYFVFAVHRVMRCSPTLIPQVILDLYKLREMITLHFHIYKAI